MDAQKTYALAADVGGTTTKVALGRVEHDRPAVIAHHVYPSRHDSSLKAVLETFLAEPDVRLHAAAISGVCLAVAGPVEQGRSRLTNLPWEIDEREIAGHFDFRRVRVINDFAAAGLGIALLDAADLFTLQAGTSVEYAPRVVLGAGTGLGVCQLLWSEGRYRVYASEAGHCDFAPLDQLQDDLLVYLRRKFGRVSCERVISGPGLPQILHFLEDTGAGEPTPALQHALAKGDAGEAITDFALRKLDPLAERTLDVFVSAYGAFAGNMALTTLAHGGVYIAGGIAPKITAKLADGSFVRCFSAKGRFQAMLETIPVRVVMNPQVGLYGALAEAARLATE